MKNATGKEGKHFDRKELLALARDAEERKAPPWVVRGLLEQTDEQA